ncbi:ATP-binding cassette domain-containing protein [Actinosynnema sp.]|uniref:ATP-binding cassette domain-containing protein n=1 Tax=Actinosynnema sp. TaxID=1872144 RepID=UPI003F86B337
MTRGSEVEHVLEASALTLRHRRGGGLRDCAFRVPRGGFAALVGPNGAGKSTLMRLAVGLLRPDSGELLVLGERPGRSGAHPRVGYLGQTKPLYRGFTTAEVLRAGAELNPGWDAEHALRLVENAGVPLDAKVDRLSGGQRTRVALALALGRRPELLLLDEPLAELDPLARREVMGALLGEVADTGMSVLMSSHVLSELESACDHLVLLADGRVPLEGPVDELLDAHRVLVGSADLPAPDGVVESSAVGRQRTVLARTGDVPGWTCARPSLEDLALGYLRTSRAVAP